MKTKLTTKLITISLFISVVALLSSCSVSNRISLQNPRHHLNLVKANTFPEPADKKVSNQSTASDIEPMPHHSSLVSYQSDDQVKELNSLLKADIKTITKQAKKSNPSLYHQLKSVNVNKVIHQFVTHSSKFSTAHTNDAAANSGRYLVLWIVFLLLAILFYILSVGAGIFFLFGVLCDVAAIIFFILWIVSFIQ